MKVNLDLIKRANNALHSCKIIKDGKYEKEFSGYISSFGASIVQSGLLATVIFYGNEESQAKERKKVVEAIEYIIDIEKSALRNNLLNDASNEKELLKKVTEAAVALKLALRMYQKKGE